MQAADIVQEHLGIVAIVIGKQVFACFDVDDALMDVHGTARMVAHRFGHECAIDPVLERGFTQRAFEQECLIGQFKRRTVIEVHFKLGGARLVAHGIGVDIHGFAIVIEVFDQRIEFVDRINAKGV